MSAFPTFPLSSIDKGDQTIISNKSEFDLFTSRKAIFSETWCGSNFTTLAKFDIALRQAPGNIMYDKR